MEVRLLISHIPMMKNSRARLGVFSLDDLPKSGWREENPANWDAELLDFDGCGGRKSLALTDSIVREGMPEEIEAFRYGGSVKLETEKCGSSSGRWKSSPTMKKKSFHSPSASSDNSSVFSNLDCSSFSSNSDGSVFQKEESSPISGAVKGRGLNQTRPAKDFLEFQIYDGKLIESKNSPIPAEKRSPIQAQKSSFYRKTVSFSEKIEIGVSNPVSNRVEGLEDAYRVFDPKSSSIAQKGDINAVDLPEEKGAKSPTSSGYGGFGSKQNPTPAVWGCKNWHLSRSYRDINLSPNHCHGRSMPRKHVARRLKSMLGYGYQSGRSPFVSPQPYQTPKSFFNSRAGVVCASVQEEKIMSNLCTPSGVEIWSDSRKSPLHCSETRSPLHFSETSSPVRNGFRNQKSVLGFPRRKISEGRPDQSPVRPWIDPVQNAAKFRVEKSPSKKCAKENRFEDQNVVSDQNLNGNESLASKLSKLMKIYSGKSEIPCRPSLNASKSNPSLLGRRISSFALKKKQKLPSQPKSGDASRQGHLHCVIRDENPSFTFVVGGSNEVLVARTTKLSSISSTQESLFCTFHSWKGGPNRRRWRKWGHRRKKESDVIGRMKISCSNSDDSNFLDLQFVLIDEPSKDFCANSSSGSPSPRLSFSSWDNGSPYRSPLIPLACSSSPIRTNLSPVSGPLLPFSSNSSQYLFRSMIPRGLICPQSPTREKVDDEFDLLWKDMNFFDRCNPQQELAAILIRIPARKKCLVPNWGFGGRCPSPSRIGGLGSSSRSNFGDQPPVTVVLPAGDHGRPAACNSGGAYSLLERWSSGGNCDCGGWDLGCGLTILGSNSSQSILEDGSVQIFSTGKQPELIMNLAPLRDELFSVKFQSPISPLKALASAVAILYSRGPSIPVMTSHEAENSRKPPRFPLRSVKSFTESSLKLQNPSLERL